MSRMIAAVLGSLLVIAVQAGPSLAADCLGDHAKCTNECVRKGDLGDPNCAIRCRETYDSCKGGGITGTGTQVFDRGVAGTPTVPTRPKLFQTAPKLNQAAPAQ